jgi:hypothetical protein
MRSHHLTKKDQGWGRGGGVWKIIIEIFMNMAQGKRNSLEVEVGQVWVVEGSQPCVRDERAVPDKDRRGDGRWIFVN